MTKMIIGLGNPGPEYVHTRHNVGFLLIDAFAKQHDIQWRNLDKFKAQIAEYSTGGEKILLVKPQTFYNLSGEAAQAIKSFYKIEPQNIVVIHDELALPFGTVRTRQAGSDAGNNGIKSLTQHLGAAYGRIRVGIWHEMRDQMPDANYVLGKLNLPEQKKLEVVSQEVSRLLHGFIQTDSLPATTWKLPES